MAGRPRGIALTAALIALNGLASLYGAFLLLQVGDPGLAIQEIAIGAFLVHRAWAVWTIQRGAYLVTVAVLGVKAALAALELYRMPTEMAWLNLLVGIAALVYLLRPRTRRLFLEHLQGH